MSLNMYFLHSMGIFSQTKDILPPDTIFKGIKCRQGSLKVHSRNKKKKIKRIMAKVSRRINRK